MGEEYKKINRVLVNLINEIWELEGKAIITPEFRDITNNDMHVIEAVGTGREIICLPSQRSLVLQWAPSPLL